MKYYRIYLLLLSTVCMNPFLYSSDYTHSSDRSQNIPLQVTSSAHLFNSSSNEIKGQNQMNSPPVINSQYNDFEKNDYTSQNTATSSSEDDDSSWGLPPLNSSESHSFGCFSDESGSIFELESPKREDNIFENSSFSTSRFMISTPVEENPLDNTAPETNSSETKNNIVLSSNIASTANSSSNKMEEESSEANSSQKRKLDNSSQQLSSKKSKKDTSSLKETYSETNLKSSLDNNVSTASSLKKRKRKIELDAAVSQQNPSKESKKDTFIQDSLPSDYSNSTFSSMEKEALYEKMLKEAQTQFEVAFNLQGHHDYHEFFKVIFSKLLPNIEKNYDRVQIYVCILRCLGYTIREIALFSQIDGYLGLGYLPLHAPSWFEKIVQDLKLTDDQFTLVQNHLSCYKDMNQYCLKPQIGGIYQKYNSIFTKRRAHSK